VNYALRRAVGKLGQAAHGARRPNSAAHIAATGGFRSRVTDVAAEFSISLNSVSKHIRLLERARLIKRNVSGREHILGFRPEPLSEAQQWIAAQQAFWASRLQAIDDLLTAEDATNEMPLRKEKA
jgi:DNA-binding MarR family transcriptional regulator